MTFREALPLLKFTDADSPEAAVQHITANWLAKDDAHIVHIAYYASYVLMEKDPGLLASMLLADNILVDGVGMQTYFRLLTGHSPSNLNGTDLSPVWIDHLQENRYPFVFTALLPTISGKAPTTWPTSTVSRSSPTTRTATPRYSGSISRSGQRCSWAWVPLSRKIG